MKKQYIPLKECSVNDIYNGDNAIYSIPIYQRNYAWGKDEINALIQDVYDAFSAKSQIPNTSKHPYYIGTLVSYLQGDDVYEIIDGQQRLTTLYIVLKALKIEFKNTLGFKSRKKSSATIKSIPNFTIDETDDGIKNGYFHAVAGLKEIVPPNKLEEYKKYFLHQVKIIHYEVPKDIDLNHYFEIMNSRGEQLEKHEIIKARLMSYLRNEVDKKRFHEIWDNCSEMGVYIQQRFRKTQVFDENLLSLSIESFDDLPTSEGLFEQISINELLQGYQSDNISEDPKGNLDTFQPIIDFPNFLLHVLKLIRSRSSDFDPTNFNLDDKDLIKEFNHSTLHIDELFVKDFAITLLKCKFYLDNFLVHHTHEEDTNDHNPWKLEHLFKKSDGNEREYLKNLGGEYQKDTHEKLAHLLSMFEVTFTARQRKNYLFYCLKYLFEGGEFNIERYLEFVNGLAQQFLHKVYLVKDNLNEINTPKPGSFDAAILHNSNTDQGWVLQTDNFRSQEAFEQIYGDGTVSSVGISLFIFNYLDYKIWEIYANELKGKNYKKEAPKRIDFFKRLGCSDFGLERFEQFYFSRTRRSLEHYFPQANVALFKDSISEAQINCFGNYAMIGNEANSSGSNWSPVEKRNRYLDSSGKVRHISIASLKFFVMMQICEDNRAKRRAGYEWIFEDIEKHMKSMCFLLNLY